MTFKQAQSKKQSIWNEWQLLTYKMLQLPRFDRFGLVRKEWKMLSLNQSVHIGLEQFVPTNDHPLFPSILDCSLLEIPLELCLELCSSWHTFTDSSWGWGQRKSLHGIEKAKFSSGSLKKRKKGMASTIELIYKS